MRILGNPLDAPPTTAAEYEGPTNRDRARWAAEAVANFRARTGTDKEDAICDLLANLMHLCESDPSYGGFQDELTRATNLFTGELHDKE